MKNNIPSDILNLLPQAIVVLAKNKGIVFLNKKAQKSLKIKKTSKPSYSFLKKLLFKKGFEKKKWGNFEVFILQKEKDPFEEPAMLVSLCSHQLRSPLTNVKWTLRMLLDEEFGYLNPEQKEFLARTLEATERAILLVNHLVSVDVLRGRKNIQTISLKEFIDELKTSLKDYLEQIKQKRIKLFFFSPQKIKGNLHIDLERVKSVFKNLLDNAIKYSFENSKIVVQIVKQKKELMVRVKDEGIGICKEEQKKVFSPFFRGKNAVRRTTSGIGLGLYLCKKIIQKNKGKIGFQSKEGKGSLFYFTLPIK